MRCCRSVWAMFINPRVLSAYRVVDFYFLFFLFHKFSNFTPPPPPLSLSLPMFTHQAAKAKELSRRRGETAYKGPHEAGETGRESGLSARLPSIIIVHMHLFSSTRNAWPSRWLQGCRPSPPPLRPPVRETPRVLLRRGGGVNKRNNIIFFYIILNIYMHMH